MRKIKKIILYFFIFVFILLSIGITYFYIQFNNYELNDDFKVNDKNLSFFQNSYNESRAAFLEKANDLKKKHPKTKVFKLDVESEIDDSLTIDFCYIPAKDSSKLLTLSSGVHGIEGNVGCAMQLFFMENYLNEKFTNESGILLIHGVNPYGFKYNRRASENNVDLNRNSDIDEELFKTKNEAYRNINSFVNPQEPIEVESFYNRFFFIPAIKKILEKGMPFFRQAVLQGQYEFPKGLYFGGKAFEPQIKKIQTILDTICSPYQIVFSIDLHTGYGKRGKLHLFPNPVELEMKNRMEYVFEGFQINWGNSDDFYLISGAFINLIQKINSTKTFIPMTFEFGTMDSQTTIGAIKSLHIMLIENQGVHYGYSSPSDSIKISKYMQEMFFPSSIAWRSQAIKEFREILELALPRYYNIEISEKED